MGGNVTVFGRLQHLQLRDRKPVNHHGCRDTFAEGSRIVREIWSCAASAPAVMTFTHHSRDSGDSCRTIRTYWLSG